MAERALPPSLSPQGAGRGSFWQTPPLCPEAGTDTCSPAGCACRSRLSSPSAMNGHSRNGSVITDSTVFTLDIHVIIDSGVDLAREFHGRLLERIRYLHVHVW